MSSPQSIRDRLTNLARERNIDVQLTFTTYAIERTLYRLSLTPTACSRYTHLSFTTQSLTTQQRMDALVAVPDAHRGDLLEPPAKRRVPR